MLAGLASCEILSQYPQSAFQGLCAGHERGSAAVCDPNPPRPFARYRFEQGRVLTPLPGGGGSLAWVRKNFLLREPGSYSRKPG